MEGILEGGHLSQISTPEKIFDQYWQEYLTADMARLVDLPKPLFRNLREYLVYKNLHDLLERLEGTDDEA